MIRPKDWLTDKAHEGHRDAFGNVIFHWGAIHGRIREAHARRAMEARQFYEGERLALVTVETK